MQIAFRSAVAVTIMSLAGCYCSSGALVSGGGCSTGGCAPGTIPLAVGGGIGAAGYGGGCNSQACDIAAQQSYSSGLCFGSALGGGVKSVLAVPLGAATFVGGTVHSFFGCLFNCSAAGGIQSVYNTDPCACDGCGTDLCGGDPCSCGGGLSAAAIPVAPPVVPAPAYIEPSQATFMQPTQNCQPCQQQGVMQQGGVIQQGGAYQQFSQPPQINPVPPALPINPVQPADNIGVPANPGVPIPQDVTGANIQKTSWRFAASPTSAISAF